MKYNLKQKIALTTLALASVVLGVTPALTQAAYTPTKTPEERCAYIAYLIGTPAEGQYRTCVFLQYYYDDLASRGYTGSIDSILTEPLPTPPATESTPTPTPTPTPIATPTPTPQSAATPTPTSQSTPVTTKETVEKKATSAPKAVPAVVATSTPSPTPSVEPTYTLTQNSKTVTKARPAFDLQLPSIGIVLALAGLSVLAAVYFAASREDQVNK